MAAQHDPNDFDDLMGLDLSMLDLDHIELEEDHGPHPAWRWVTLLFLIGMGTTILWLPSTDYYQTTDAHWLFVTICIVATVVGALAGRWLWRWAEEAAAHWAARRKPREVRESQPPSTAQRVLTLLAAIAGGGAILFAVSPSDLSGGGSGYSGLWFLVSGGALIVGGLLGRWLLMQEHNPFKRLGQIRRIELPPWFKWVTLTVIVGASVLIMVGMELFPSNDPESLEFSLGGAAFIIGIMAAVWVAHRFDETEARIRKQVQQQRSRRR